ncbi:4'-phosphopantetheinyl transferase superfamily protein [Streptomyces sp. PTY087I2]|uniref:4'-phosphopantetheinyl transferase family protein n=1 Tax=Streptomyces sp. PTY087I2 TaxID=1819298 RepID=UPI00080BBC0C|nr:4'-phosphopantetheinyl transferase superfamily protein [Streptomyces sp. PTY087I2]OCC10603.1 4'-phosphopantetheinyl transferase sfp [Streptomyces sp. PTY087I2]
MSAAAVVGGDPVTGTADVWLLPEHAIDAFAAECGGEGLLSEDERTRMARLLRPADRKRFLARRMLCRFALSARTGRPLGEWRFTIAPHGRPEPEPGTDGLRFSLADTRGLVVCAVTAGRACGIDVEQTSVSAESAHHISRFFASEELLELSALDPDALVARVGELWVLKEAYLKAQGTGLHRSLAGFSFAPRGPTGAGRITVRDSVRPGAWTFELFRPGPDHLVALAVEGDDRAAVRQTWLTGSGKPTDPRRGDGP